MGKIENYNRETMLEFLKVYNQNVFSIYNSIDYIRDSLTSQDKKELDEILNTLAGNCYNMIKNTSNMSLYIKIKNNQISISDNDIICVQKELRQIVETSNKILGKEIIKFNNNIEELLYLNVSLEWLSAIIFNLINNSLKAIEENGHIDILVEKLDDKCIISVSDNGIGMTKDILDNVKKESFGYNISDNTKTSAGVGFYIVNQIIKVLNGEISIDSEYKIGTKVTLKIPTIKNKDNLEFKFENNNLVNEMYYNDMSDLHAFLKG